MTWFPLAEHFWDQKSLSVESQSFPASSLTADTSAKPGRNMKRRDHAKATPIRAVSVISSPCNLVGGVDEHIRHCVDGARHQGSV